ncbi:MAG: hypothetical protein FWC56_05245, partial [Phycisphaerae bacterium]|nr:hypothetical protein [Phycisphaerae bacterium]
SGNWEASVSNGIHQAIAKRSIQWLRPTARLCLFRPWKANSTTPPYANVTIGGKRTSTRNNGRGVQVNSGGTRSTIDPLTYRIEFGQIIDVDITQAGTNSGSDLTVNLNFVLE